MEKQMYEKEIGSLNRIIKELEEKNKLLSENCELLREKVKSLEKNPMDKEKKNVEKNKQVHSSSSSSTVAVNSHKEIVSKEINKQETTVTNLETKDDTSELQMSNESSSDETWSQVVKKKNKTKNITNRPEPLKGCNEEITLKTASVSFDQYDPCKPAVLCSGCYIKLNQGSLDEIVDYTKLKNFVHPNSTRQDSDCQCKICQVARFRFNPKGPRKLPFKFTLKKLAVGRPLKHNNKIKKDTIKVCSICTGIVKRGLKHICTVSKKIENIAGLAKNCKQQVASTIILKEELEQGDSSISLNKGRGCHMQINVLRKANTKANPVITSTTLREMQIDCNLPVSSVKKIVSTLRNVDKHLVEKQAIPKIQECSHVLDQYFDGMFLPNVELSKKQFGLSPFVYCNNLSQLVAYILDKRILDENFHLKIGIDGGAGSLKICLNILSDGENSVDGATEKSKNSGIKKLIIIGLGPKMIESYHNIKYLMETIDIHTIIGLCPYTFASDFKLIMMILSLQSNSSAHPCPWCDVSCTNLESKGISRTIHTITDQYQQWQSNTNGDIAKAKYYGNCTNIPLIVGNEHEPVLKYIPPPELHLLLGVVQKIFDLLKTEIPEKCEEWVTVWCGISAKRDMLENFEVELEEEDRQNMWFQQDDAAAHNRKTMKILRRMFPGRVLQ
ncbi:unnamed protein product [Brassicogethes aeneus]|uniref:Uncharacterized protein n=1 Tax=Brassicogethes aeneus TaxID=1431903 RepID=A0A9P0B1E1_BRAAE|nr:unnamed protein product [Brassicogethes aeneus]